MQRRADPINTERLKELEELESQFEDRLVPLEKLVEAFVTSPVRMHFDRSSGSWLFPRLMTRALTEANADIHQLFMKTFGEVFMRFSAAFTRALPGLSPVEIGMRMHLMIGALAFTIAIPSIHPKWKQHGQEDAAVGPLEKPVDVDEVLSRLVGFVSAGMRSPAPPQGAGENG
jgi:hypothetical protein